MKENLVAIKNLLTQRKGASHGGWQLPSELNITCMDVRRDEDTFEDSQMAQNFRADRDVAITVNAILLVPGKAVIGIVQLEDQEVDEKVASVPLLQNDFNRRHQFSSFVRASCTARGPFGSIV